MLVLWNAKIAAIISQEKMIPPQVLWWFKYRGTKINTLKCFLLFVIKLVKRGLPHASNLPTSTNHNLRCVKVMNLKFSQPRALA